MPCVFSQRQQNKQGYNPGSEQTSLSLGQKPENPQNKC